MATKGIGDSTITDGTTHVSDSAYGTWANTQCHIEIDEIKRLRKNLNKKLVFKKLKYGTLKPRLARMRSSLRGL